MADYPRFNELFEIALREMILRNTALTEETVRTKGTDANSIAAMMAQVGEEVARQCAITATNRLLGTATGEELDRVVYDWFGLVRNDAAAAMATVTFTRSTAVAGTLPAGFKVATADGVEFQLAIPLSFGTADLALSGICRCSVTGIIGNVSANTINQMIDTASFDLTFTCNNAARAAGGGKRESDDEFKNRARQFWLVAQRGTLGAIQLGALEVDGVGTSSAREVPVPDPNGNGTVAEWVSLTVADRSGYGNALLRTAVISELDNWRAAGVYVEVLAASVSIQQITATFSFVPGCDTVAVTERIRQALINYVNGLRIEESLRKNALWDIIRRDRDVVKESVAIVAPAGDVTPAAGSTTLIRTDYASVKLN
jgi:hypothetical protein